MIRKNGLCAIVLFFALFISPLKAEAATAVTISVEDGPALTEGNLVTVELLIPESLPEGVTLAVGDKVFFETLLNPLLSGEGTIISIYDTEDVTIEKASILDHIHHQ